MYIYIYMYDAQTTLAACMSLEKRHTNGTCDRRVRSVIHTIT